MVEEQWQVNSGHPDYRAVAERPALKLRYLANLFAKEVVLKSHQDPRFAEPLEQLVEIAAYADLYLTQTRRARTNVDGSGATDVLRHRPAHGYVAVLVTFRGITDASDSNTSRK